MARVGVFVCDCGTNIAGVVDVAKVVEKVKDIPDVIMAQELKYSCSELGQTAIQEAIKEHHLDKVVVASCSPRMHEATFMKCVGKGGLNPYQFEMANIREQCSWVHEDKVKATEKALDLTRMAIAKARRLVPLTPMKMPVEKRALVIGGGIAGIQAALNISKAGYPVTLVERTPSIGGRMAQLEKTFPTLDCSAWILTPRMTESSQDENITLYTYAEIEEVKGFVGNFEVTIRKKARSVDMSKCTGCGECQQKCPRKIPNEFDLGLGNRKAIYTPFTQAVPNVPVIDREHCIYFTKGKCQACAKACPTGAIDYEQKDELVIQKFGAMVVATGFSTFDWTVYGEYGAGKIKDIVTGLHIERMLDTSGPTGGKVVRPSDGKEPKTIVFVQCVGSRDPLKGMPYCSRVCCMYTAKHALLLKDHFPESQSYVFYIDIRSPGKNYEEFVNRVQEKSGAVYIRGRVSKIYQQADKLVVCGSDTLLGEPVKIEADLVVLASAMVAQPDAKQFAQKLNIPGDQFGFFTEVHPKLEPVASVTKGIFLTGSCQFPKDIPDTVAMSGAAAVGVCSILSQEEMIIEPKIACVDETRCTGCLNCIEACPYHAIEEKPINGKVLAHVIESLCRGCGNCCSTCRVRAIEVKGFTDEQLYSQITSALKPV